MSRQPNPKLHARDAAPSGTTWSHPIHTWPAGERPRERLLQHGPAALSDAELIAVLLGNGTRGADAVATGRTLLARAGGIGRLLAGAGELAPVPGVGPVKRARLIAALELARRSLAEGLLELPAIRSVEDSYAFLKAKLAHLKHEIVGCLFLDARLRVIAFEVLSQGTIDGAMIYPREVIRACLRLHATSIILVHNHPSGDATPSLEDQEMTTMMKEALGLLEVKLLDHIVVGAGKPVSMAAMGLM